MPKVTAQELVKSVGMHTDPEYYKGRCASTRDLDGGMLARLYLTIKKELGDDAAEAFSLMVQNVKLLSALKFLKSLYALEENGWNYLAEIQKAIDEEQVDYGSLRVIYEYQMSKKNDTSYIRSSFLSNINGKNNSRFENYTRYREEYDDFWEDDDNVDDDDEEYD